MSIIEGQMDLLQQELDVVRAQRDKAESQRDQLLAALTAMMAYYDTPSGPGDLLAMADAAIALAKAQ
jgi:hypothetical protein